MKNFQLEVARLLNGIMVEDLTPVEGRIVTMLVKDGVLKINDDNGDLVVMMRKN